MESQFRMRQSIALNEAPWGFMRWISHPASTGAGQLTALDATLLPGEGHSFHKHPDQEEVLCVVEGEIEQWIEREKRLLTAGDAMFIAPGTVHGTFNAGRGDARLLVFFGPCVGDGFEAIDMSGEEPWRSLRS
jgi:quercetin dioxygenase-like cupin family protein